MKFIKSKYLFFWLLCPFVMGVISAYFTANITLFTYSKWLLIFIFASIVFLQISQKLFQWNQLKWLFGILIQLFFCFFGYFNWCWHRTELSENFFAKNSKSSLIEVEIISEPQFKNHQLQCLITARNAKIQNGKWISVSGKLKLQLVCDSIFAQKVVNGNILLLPTQMIKEIEVAKNLNVFDFKKYMFQQGVLHQIRLHQNQIQLSNHNNAWVVFRFALNLRQKCIQKFKQIFDNQIAKGIAIALILGEKSLLDEETIQNFQQTGTIHILVISGMHVMYVYLFLWFFLKRLPQKLYFKLLKTSVVFVVLGFYTMFTGFTPSVIRAFLMIILYIISNEIRRKNNKYHVLSFAAFIMLVCEPNLLFQLGFQLSFLAVLGILFAYQPLRSFLSHKWLHKYITEGIAVSLSAQIFVIPIIVYVFHSAPLNFIISNLIASIPIMILMIVGSLLLVFPWSILVFMFEWIVQILNYILHQISEMKILILKNLHISFSEMCMLAIIFITFSCMCKYKHKISLFGFLIFLLMFVFKIEARRFQAVKQQQVVYYSFYNQYAVAFIKGKNAFVLSNISTNDKRFESQILPYLNYHFVNQINVDSIGVNVRSKFLNIKGDTLSFQERKWLILHKNSAPMEQVSPQFDSIFLLDYPKFKVFPSVNNSQKVLLLGNRFSNFSEYYVDFFKEKRIKFLDMRKNIASLE